jgi:PAS domain S-box-containing protein
VARSRDRVRAAINVGREGRPLPGTTAQPETKIAKSHKSMRSYVFNAAPENGPVRVLLVDDDENSFLLTRRLLSKMQGSYTMEWASSYEAGLEAVSKRQHDVYLFDYRLGSRNGLELLREALAAGCKDPIIMLTTENPDVDAEAMRLGAADFLSKDRLDALLLERSIRYSIKHFATLRALWEREAQLASFMQHVPCAVYMKDLGGRYLYLNDTCEKVFRRKAMECVGRTDDELWPRGTAERFKRLDQGIMAEGKVHESTETVSQSDGPHYWLTSKFPIMNDEGTPIMIGGAAIDITERKRLEREIQEVSEQEKRRIGQDLHDGLGQYLTGIACMAKALQQKLADKKRVETADAAKIALLVNKTISQARDLARGLCPVELENSDLRMALQELTEGVEKLFGVSCTFECPESMVIADAAASIHLYRIVQEAINNAIKHGKATHLSLSVKAGEKGTSILVLKDDGCGLPKVKSGPGRGMGLRVMNYRASMIGGSVTVESPPEGGTVVTCAFPNGRKVSAVRASRPVRPSRARGSRVNGKMAAK